VTTIRKVVASTYVALDFSQSVFYSNVTNVWQNHQRDQLFYGLTLPTWIIICTSWWNSINIHQTYSNE
jgi:hypothetical protein